jgi:hypothetical protein
VTSLGRWLVSLEHLRSRQLDLTGRLSEAVDEFFRHIGASGSGFSTPSSARSRDSGVFSSENIDFTEIKKHARRLVDDPFHASKTRANMAQLHEEEDSGHCSYLYMILCSYSLRFAHVFLYAWLFL